MGVNKFLVSYVYSGYTVIMTGQWAWHAEWDGWLWRTYLNQLLSTINNAECAYPGRPYVIKIKLHCSHGYGLGWGLFEMVGGHGHWASGGCAVRQWPPHNQWTRQFIYFLAPKFWQIATMIFHSI